jgi:tRNA-specific 2-thiouridylase
MKKQKILLAMSGGVDSSVAALLLKKQGYEIIGAFMKNWSDTKNDLGECTWRGERRMAMKVAAMLEIPLITLDFEKQYRKEVVKKMFEDYKKGITPNPDVDCNNKVKFPLLIKEAKKLKCDFIATGHYVRIKKNKNGESELLRAKDENKDQSYFLYRLTQRDLKNTLFPIDDLTKKQVREIAQKNKFPNYNKKSTVGICFIGKVNLKKFLQKKIKPKKGFILDPEGNKIGEHDGIYYYTIGQRIGPRFGIEVKKSEKYQKKWFVARKDLKKNIIVSAPEGHKLNFRKEIIVSQPHWINRKPKNNEKVFSRIRQVGELLPSKLFFGGGKFKVILDKAITGVSQGQSIVLYHGKKCLGGGVIGF